jgi:hypothetical protein
MTSSIYILWHVGLWIKCSPATGLALGPATGPELQ